MISWMVTKTDSNQQNPAESGRGTKSWQFFSKFPVIGGGILRILLSTDKNYNQDTKTLMTDSHGSWRFFFIGESVEIV